MHALTLIKSMPLQSASSLWIERQLQLCGTLGAAPGGECNTGASALRSLTVQRDLLDDKQLLSLPHGSSGNGAVGGRASEDQLPFLSDV